VTCSRHVTGLRRSSRCAERSGRTRRPASRLVGQATGRSSVRGRRGPQARALPPARKIMSTPTFVLRRRSCRRARRPGTAPVPRLLHAPRDVGVRRERLPTLEIPVEQYPDAAVVVGVTKPEPRSGADIEAGIRRDRARLGGVAAGKVQHRDDRRLTCTLAVAGVARKSCLTPRTAPPPRPHGSAPPRPV
jgi:hypothetical protein